MNLALLSFLVILYICPKKIKRKEVDDVCAKMKSKNDTKGARIKFCTRQYLYISEYLGLGLGRRLYLPPLA